MGQNQPATAKLDGNPGFENGAIVENGAAARTMKAYTIAQPSSDLDAITDALPVPIPTPGPSEVLIKVVCAGLNPVDWKRAAFPPSEVAYPAVLGVDVSGTIVEVGSAVTLEHHHLQVGMNVHVHLDLRKKYGAFAEYVVCEASVACRMAPTVSFADAAALPCAAWTAYVALFERLKIESGKTILISGGSGGVGSFAIQFCKYMQLRVIATCSTNNLEFVKSLGADLAIDYTKEDVVSQVLIATKGESCDYVLETVSASLGVKHAQLLKFSGAIANIVGTLTMEPFFFERQLTVHHVFLGGHHRDDYNRAILRRIGETVMAMMSAGVIKVPQLELIRWDQVPGALAALKQGHVRGKIVLSMVARKDAKRGPGEATPPAEPARPTNGTQSPQGQPQTTGTQPVVQG